MVKYNLTTLSKNIKKNYPILKEENKKYQKLITDVEGYLHHKNGKQNI